MWSQLLSNPLPEHIIRLTPHFTVLDIMQSSFRPASRRETFGRHAKGGRRDGGLKIDWTKPLPSAWPMCIDRGLGSRVRI